MGEEHDGWLETLGVSFNQLEQKKNEVESSISASLQSTQDSVLSAAGVDPETARQIKAAQQGIADFDKGRDAGRASGSLGLISALPPVQLAKAVGRISDADDPVDEALNIAREKADTAAAIGNAFNDPIGSGSAFGERLGKNAVQANKEGHLAEFTGKLVGEGDVIAATVAAGGGLAGAGEGLAAASEGGIVASEEGLVTAGEEGLAATERAPVFEPKVGSPEISPAARSVRVPEVGEPFAPTQRPLAPDISPGAQSVPTPEVGEPFAPTQRPLAPDISPAAESAPTPEVGEPFAPTQRPLAPDISPAAESVPPPEVGEPFAPTERFPAQVND